MEQAVRGRRLPRRAVLAALTGAALVGTMVPGAGAITGGSTLVAAKTPTLGVGQTNQLAGDWTLTPVMPTNSWAAGEVVTITVNTPAPANCTGPTPATNFLAFNGTPTVAVSGTAAVTASTTSTFSTGPCLGKKDQLLLTFTTGGTGTVTISNIRYDIGSAVATGNVAVTATDSDASTVTTGTAASNAFLTRVLLTANSPALGLRTGSGIQAISNVVVTEQALDAAGTGTATLCLQLAGGKTFDPTLPAPTVAVSGGDAATVTLANANTALQLAVVDPPTDTGPSTFTISGLRLSTASTGVAGLVVGTLSTGACGAPVVTLSAPTTIAGVVTTNRFGGADRFTTAQLLFEGAFPCNGTGLKNAIIARADDFPDALAASYLAGKLVGDGTTPGTGILLVDKDSTTLPPATVNALRNRGVDKVTIVGGTTAVPAALATALGALPNVNCAGVTEPAPNATIAVDRISGADRFETARNIAERPGLAAAGTADYDGTAADPDGAACVPKKTAILATGTNFPDALVAGPVAFNGHNVPGAGSAVPPGTPGCGDGQGFPIILTGGTALDAQASAALTNLGIQQVLVMGGNTAIDPAVVTAVQAIGGITTKRFAGATRLDTAKQFGEFAINFLGYSRTTVSVARGDNFPDALAGGPFAGAAPANVVILTESPSSAGAETLAFLRDRQGTAGVYGATSPLSPITDVDVFGGTAAVSDAVVAALLAAISQA